MIDTHGISSSRGQGHFHFDLIDERNINTFFRVRKDHNKSHNAIS